MKRAKIIIIGGGFAGLEAAKVLTCFKKKTEVILIDRKKQFNFLPMLPDVMGRLIKPEFLIYSIEDLSKRFGFTFLNREVRRVNLEENQLWVSQESINYDYLIIACGSETNFYGNKYVERNAYKLDHTLDAKNILAFLEKDMFDIYIIAGGGYTGIEIATSLRAYFNKIKKEKRIVIVERAPSLLGPLPEWMKRYVAGNLNRLNIEILLNTTIDTIEGNVITTSKAHRFYKAVLIWSAGVKISIFIHSLDIEKSSGGRLKVDEYLRVRDNCFVIGDAANFIYKDQPLRMAVQFSLAQGRCAAKNIINSINKGKLERYKPIDLGYIIPMANNRSCGQIFNINVKGLLATFLHYLMCVYRTIGFRNKIGIIKQLIT